jgi:glutathione-regulated potassium-efflux system ancillary protein KefC
MEDLLWIGPALIAGIIAARIGLPPMVGYLLAGFVLSFFGVVDHNKLTMIGNLGVTLLLFTIGLKLDLRSLLRPAIWAGTTLHTLIVIALFGTFLYWLSLTGLKVFSGLDIKIAMLIGFALSFSSTVFAVKTLEDKGEYLSKYGQTAIGVLIVQDIFAVIFLAASTGKLPSIWALALLALIPLRFVLMHLLSRSGHSELQILFGIAMAFGGYALFDAVDVKGDLGALLVGALLATHPLASEMSKRLLGFKDLLLVGFFLSIGISSTLSLSVILVALGLSVLVILKVTLFFVLFTRFKMRARTSVLSSLALANYSEFGLIVCALAVSNSWLTEDWLVIIALALTMTIIVAAPINMRATNLYESIKQIARKFESRIPLPEDAPISTGEAKIVVVGMGRLGTAVYDTLKEDYGDLLIGVDNDADKVAQHKVVGRNVIRADATEDEFWEHAPDSRIEIAVLALREHVEKLSVAHMIQHKIEQAKIFTVAGYQEEAEELKVTGVHTARDLYAEAGTGLAQEVIEYCKAEPGRAVRIS